MPFSSSTVTPSWDAWVRQRTNVRRSKVYRVNVAVDPAREGILRMHATQGQQPCRACDIDRTMQQAALHLLKNMPLPLYHTWLPKHLKSKAHEKTNT